MWMILSNSSKKMLMNTTNSIATGFSILDVGEFVGSEELKHWPLDHLFLKSRIFLTASELIRSCSHKVGWSLSVQGECPKWRCRKGLRVQYCQDVWRLLRPIRWLAASLCTFRSAGTAGGLSFLCSLYLFLNSLSLVCTCVVPRFLRGEYRGVFHF